MEMLATAFPAGSIFPKKMLKALDIVPSIWYNIVARQPHHNTKSNGRKDAIERLTERQVKIRYLIKKLRYRYSHPPVGEEAHYKALDDVLTNIIWYSYPVTYLDHESSDKLISGAMKRRRQAKWRLNRRIRDMFECYDELWFATFTLNDEALERLSERTQHRYMQAWLNENCRDYVANEDYGKKNGRRHYHAVIAKKEALEPWKYGFYKLKRVKMSDETSVHKLSSYLLKLVNHANKLTTGKHFSKRGWKEVDSLPF